MIINLQKVIKFFLPALLFYNNTMKKISAEMILDVPFYDADSMKVVWHGNYVKYLEIARCDLLSKVGYTYLDMMNEGIAYPVATMELKYIKSAKFGQKLKIITEITEYEPALYIKYDIFDNETGEKLFKAKSMQICIDAKTGESIYSAPKKFVEKLEEYA